MKGVILDQIVENSGTCYLVKASLNDFVESLPEDYKNYEVQREIVSNVYLDNLIQTVLEQKHIPSLVLVAEDGHFERQENDFVLDDFKILDGLQRTFRLKMIHETIKLLVDELRSENDIVSLSKIQLSRKYREKLEKFNGSSLYLSKLIEYFKRSNSEIQKLHSLFQRNQWFEIWVGLDPTSEVNKMLLLNAGHKPVKTKHQLELLFRNIIPVLKKIDYSDFSIVRERERSSISFAKTRTVGQFHFSSLITSILSFGEGRPLTSNTDLIQKKQSDYFDDFVFESLLRFEFLNEFVKTLLEIDKKLHDYYGEEGTRWFGRETTLVGLFAAAGKVFKERNTKSPEESLTETKERIVANPGILKLKEFEKERNSLDLAKINIGTINKRALFNGVYDVLTNKIEAIDWSHYFKSTDND